MMDLSTKVLKVFHVLSHTKFICKCAALTDNSLYLCLV